MPGAGKNTIGVLLAKHANLNFLDTDLLLQTREGRSLQQMSIRTATWACGPKESVSSYL